VLEKALGKLSTLGGRFGPMMQQFGSMMGVNTNTEDMFGKLEDMRAVITEVNNQFKDPVRCYSFTLILHSPSLIVWIN
jgi:arsenite-transporting ATPase